MNMYPALWFHERMLPYRSDPDMLDMFTNIALAWIAIDEIWK